ncbi:P-loop containing nucleoside triphosphate hydrolase protein [Ilyonectria sp. MPI-CAGE-AT-0026]|nr:P-loop containing nucleoside triphosphate hydrolase protein [Ilyonectria sp. MPI-CAGE-AT-0026]
MKPVVKHLRSVSGVASAIAPTSPEIGVMIWGSVSLIAKLSSTNKQVALKLIQALEPVGSEFALFGRYLALFPKNQDLRKATINYSAEVIHLLSYSVRTLQEPKYVLPPISAIERQLGEKMTRITRQAKEVQRQVKLAKLQSEHDWRQRMDSSQGTSTPKNDEDRQDGQPSRVHFLSILENKKFSGRAETLEQLQTQLIEEDGAPRAGASVLLHGLGGVGKSELAVKFIYSHLDQYPYIFWLTAETREKLSISITHVCKELRAIPPSVATDSNSIPLVWRSWLAENKGYLIVFDNAESESVVRDFWPLVNKGSIFITSRHPHVGATLVDYDHEIRPMSTVESRDLFYKLLPARFQAMKPKEFADADEICKIIDGLPLAIVLAASLVRETQRNLQETLNVLSASRDLLLNWSANDPEDEVQSALMTLWEANISSLSLESLQLLQVIAFLDPDGIDEALLRDSRAAKLRNIIPNGHSVFLLALRNLFSHSLIRRDLDALSIHRLVQDVTIRRMGDDKRIEAFDVALDLIWAVFPRQTEEGLLMSSENEECEKCLAHVESLEVKYLELSARADYSPIKLAEIAYFCSWSMFERGMFSRAMKLAFTGVRIVDSSPAETRLLRADLFTTIGGCQLEITNAFEDAYTNLEKALQFRLDASKAGLMDADHPQIANSYMSLGTAAAGNRLNDVAMELAGKSIELREERKEDQIQMLAMSYHNLAIAALMAGQLDKAENSIMEAQRLSEIKCRSMTIEQQAAMDARTLYCLGNIRLAQGLHPQAIELHERALIVRLECFKEVHPYVACSNWKLGTLYEGTDWAKAV